MLLGPALADALSADAVELDPKGKLRERVIKVAGPVSSARSTARVAVWMFVFDIGVS